MTPPKRPITAPLSSTRRSLALAVLIRETNILRIQRSVERLKVFVIGDLGYAE
jgi:hypothetical protein